MECVDALSTRWSAAEELQVFEGRSSYSSTTEENADDSDGPAYTDLTNAWVVESRATEERDAGGTSPRSDTANTHASVWDVDGSCSQSRSRSRPRPQPRTRSAVRKTQFLAQCARLRQNVLSAGGPIQTRSDPNPRSGRQADHLLRSGANVRNATVTEADASAESPSPSSLSSAALRSVGASIVQQYNEQPFTTESLLSHMRRKHCPIDIVKLVRQANAFNRSGKHDLESLVHQHIEVALQLNIATARLERSSATTSSLQKQLTMEARHRTRIYADHFGSPNYSAAPGKWELPASAYGPGSSLTRVYEGLRRSEVFPKVVTTSDAHKFFRQFIKDLVTEAYDEPNRPYLTARSRANSNDFIVIPYTIIIEFVMETMKHGGIPLCAEDDEVERHRIERGILACIQVALESYRRKVKKPDDDDHDDADDRNH